MAAKATVKKNSTAKGNREQRRRADKKANNGAVPQNGEMDPATARRSLNKRSIDQLKVEVANFYVDVEAAEGLEMRAEQLRLQAKRMRKMARDNIGFRRDIIAEKEARQKAKE